MTVVISVILEPEVERESRGEVHVRSVTYTGYHLIPPVIETHEFNKKYFDFLLLAIIIKKCAEGNFINENMDQGVLALTNLNNRNIF